MTVAGLGISGTDAGNYTLTNLSTTSVANITKANAIVTANSDLTKIYNGSIQSVMGFTATGLVGGETVSVLAGVTANGAGINAGTYTTTATGSDSNYNLTFINGSLVIKNNRPQELINPVTPSSSPVTPTNSSSGGAIAFNSKGGGFVTAQVDECLEAAEDCGQCEDTLIPNIEVCYIHSER